MPGCFQREISSLVPTATMRLSVMATASTSGRAGSTVQIFPLTSSSVGVVCACERISVKKQSRRRAAELSWSFRIFKSHVLHLFLEIEAEPLMYTALRFVNHCH